MCSELMQSYKSSMPWSLTAILGMTNVSWWGSETGWLRGAPCKCNYEMRVTWCGEAENCLSVPLISLKKQWPTFTQHLPCIVFQGHLERMLKYFRRQSSASFWANGGNWDEAEPSEGLCGAGKVLVLISECWLHRCALCNTQDIHDLYAFCCKYIFCN